MVLDKGVILELIQLLEDAIDGEVDKAATARMVNFLRTVAAFME